MSYEYVRDMISFQTNESCGCIVKKGQGGAGQDSPDSTFDEIEVIVRDQIHLVQEDHIGRCDLSATRSRSEIKIISWRGSFSHSKL